MMDEMNVLNAPKKVVDGLTEVFEGLAQMFEGVSDQLELLGADAAPEDKRIFPIVDQEALDVLDFFEVLALLDLHQLGFEHLHGHLTVLVLAALILAGDDNPGRQMGDPYGRGSLVDMLSSRARRAVGIHPQVVGIDLHLNGVVNLGHNLERSEGGVPPPR